MWFFFHFDKDYIKDIYKKKKKKKKKRFKYFKEYNVEKHYNKKWF